MPPGRALLGKGHGAYRDSGGSRRCLGSKVGAILAPVSPGPPSGRPVGIGRSPWYFRSALPSVFFGPLFVLQPTLLWSSPPATVQSVVAEGVPLRLSWCGLLEQAVLARASRRGTEVEGCLHPGLSQRPSKSRKNSRPLRKQFPGDERYRWSRCEYYVLQRWQGELGWKRRD